MEEPHRKPVTPQPPSPETLAQFSSYPWTQAYFTSKSYTPIFNGSRQPRHTTHESILWSTLNTPTTIPAWQNFHNPKPSPEYPYGHFISLVKLGSDINGHDHVAHGGFLGVLLDEVIGTACECEADRRISTMTAYLNVGFKRPVKTPGVVLLRGWVERKEGRKMWARGTVEDGDGNVATTGEGLFISLRENL